MEHAWNQLALPAGTPFLTHEWVRSWWGAFGAHGAIAGLLYDGEGRLIAGAALSRSSRRRLDAAANDYSDDWDVIAVDEEARRQLWEGIALLPAAELTFPGMPGDGQSAAIAAEAMRAGGCRVAVIQQPLSPYVALADSWDQFLEGRGRNKRSRVRRRMKKLEGEGNPEFKTWADPDQDAALDRFLQIEASGWKGEAGTAILDDPRALRLYTEFAHAAAKQGWLRIHLLELDGAAIAGDFGCILGDAEFLVKTGFDERYAHVSPGAVVRAEALREAMAEGLTRYEFLGGPDRYKLQWGGDLRERLLIRGYRGSALPTFLYRHKLRPLAGRLLGRGRPAAEEG